LGGTNPFVASAASAIAGRPYGHSRRSNKAHASTADSARGYGTPQAGQPLKVVRMENLDGLVIDAHLPRPIDASADCGPRSPGSLGVNRRVGSCSAPFHQRTAPVSACANGSKRPSRGSRRPPDRTAGQKRTRFQDWERARAFPFAAPAYNRARLPKRCDEEAVLKAKRATSLETLDAPGYSGFLTQDLLNRIERRLNSRSQARHSIGQQHRRDACWACPRRRLLEQKNPLDQRKSSSD
jgi:hypothetical protein